MKILLSLVFTLSLAAVYGKAITNEEKSAVVEKVYRRVYATLGLSEEAPKFFFDTRRSMQIAYMTKDRDGFPLIGFEAKAYEVCEQFGPRMEDAIALLIGHEISHHHLNHHWGEDFRSAYSLSGLEKELKEIDKSGLKKFEVQADERGGILCFLAGYNTSGLAPELLKRLYKAYELKDSPSYPTLDERMQIAKERDSVVSSYIKVFETGNYAMLIGEYKLAIDCFEKIIGSNFHSAEIYNNLGIAYFLSAIKADDKSELKYLYPIELDMGGKTKGANSKGFGDGSYSQLMEEATKKFKQAIGFDENYTTGYLNLACVYSATNLPKKAVFYLDEAETLGKKQNALSTLDNAKMLKAIVAHQMGDKDGAISLLNELVKKENMMAKGNLSIIQDGMDVSSISLRAIPATWTESSYHKGEVKTTRFREKIDGLNYYSLSELQGLSIPVQVIPIAKNSEVSVGEFADSKVYVFEGADGTFFAFHHTMENYKGVTSQGLKVGSTQDEIIDKYGLPDAVLMTNRGAYLTYSRSQLFFWVNQDRKLSSWMIYRTVDDI